MRNPRPGLRWSQQRVQHRVNYALWMSSPEWLARRRRWRAAWVAAHLTEPVCLICGRPWTLESGELHHRSYRRLGDEADEDLIPLCRTPCHEQLHRVLESHPAWVRSGRAHATDVIVARLRATLPDKEHRID